MGQLYDSLAKMTPTNEATTLKRRISVYLDEIEEIKGIWEVEKGGRKGKGEKREEERWKEWMRRRGKGGRRGKERRGKKARVWKGRKEIEKLPENSIFNNAINRFPAGTPLRFLLQNALKDGLILFNDRASSRGSVWGIDRRSGNTTRGRSAE